MTRLTARETEQRNALAAKLCRIAWCHTHGAVHSIPDKPPVPIEDVWSPFGQGSHSSRWKKVWMWLYEHNVERRQVHLGWKTSVPNNTLPNEHYGPRELGITVEGNLIDSFVVETPTTPLSYWRVVGPHMALSDTDYTALNALADRIICMYRRKA